MVSVWIIYGSGWWLSPTPLKNMSSSIGMMNSPRFGKIKVMFQTTNQIMYIYICMKSSATLALLEMFGSKRWAALNKIPHLK